MGWVWGEEWQAMERQWHLHKFWGNYRGDLWVGRAIFLLCIGSSDTPLCFWLTLALERQFLQLSTIAIHNTATGRCIPPERTRATICINIFWDHQWKLMRMHNKEISSPFSSPFIYFTQLLLIEGWLWVLPSFQTQGIQQRKKSCLSLHSSGRRQIIRWLKGGEYLHEKKKNQSRKGGKVVQRQTSPF